MKVKLMQKIVDIFNKLPEDYSIKYVINAGNYETFEVIFTDKKERVFHYFLYTMGDDDSVLNIRHIFHPKSGVSSIPSILNTINLSNIIDINYPTELRQIIDNTLSIDAFYHMDIITTDDIVQFIQDKLRDRGHSVFIMFLNIEVDGFMYQYDNSCGPFIILKFLHVNEILIRRDDSPYNMLRSINKLFDVSIICHDE